jgi:phosphoglucomutase/phosphopentomutase
MTLGCSDLDAKVANWLQWDKNDKNRAEIQKLVDEKDVDGLKARMNGQLLFGTAGIRAPMQAGFARLNDLTIIQVTHGFAKYLKQQFPGESRGVAIGFDGRHNSRRFAQLASNVFIKNGIKVYLFSEVAPTPVVSWAVINLKCDAGLMVTASHNPKEDNGYKAYWSNGAQIIDPHDVEIIKLKEAEPQPRDEYWDLSELDNNPLLHSADVTIDPYFEAEKSNNYYRSINEKTPLKFTYSAFHGIGYHYSTRMLREFGFRDDHVFSVKEQQEPDPDFPTIPFPNPEEGRKVLTLSLKTADLNDSTVVLANDPDADRLQMAEKQSPGEWYIFTGNEMGTLMTWWIWKNWRERNPDADLKDIYILNSAVSSQVVKTMAEKEGFQNDITLTGFKWMGNLAHDLTNKGKKVILAWEESIGFMPGHTLDKDGVSSAAIFAEMAAWLHEHGKSLHTKLFEIYEQYGFHLVRSTYWIVPNPQVTKNLFGSLRKDLKYPPKIGKDHVEFVRDLTIGYDNSQPGNKPLLPISTSSEMITFTLKNGSIATLRASGTEPKIKYYIELRTAPGKKQSDLEDVKMELEQLEKNVVETLLRPEHFELIARK